MSTQMNIEPSSQTFADLMSSNTRYLVPRFQRDYSWEQEQWEDLWNDIRELEQEGSHYMGYIVLQQKEKNQYEIIDGQQRMVTLTLLILAYMSKLKSFIENDEDKEDNEERLEVISKRYIGVKSLITLSVDSRLTLNRNNKTYFKDICDNLKPSNPTQITVSNNYIRKAFEFLVSKIELDNGLAIAENIEYFTSSLVFTKIVVQDSINAYKVFETLNARGVMLSTPDLIKNYIFSTIAQTGFVTDSELDELDEKWSSVISQLGEKNFTDFIRHLFNSEHEFVTKKDLFKKVREKYQTPQEASSYLNSLSKNAALYTSLLNHHEEWWKSIDQKYIEVKPYLESFKLFGIKQPNIVLLAAYQKFTPEEFVKTAKYLYVLSIRYNVICNHSASEQEKRYNTIAQNISNGSIKRASKVKDSNEFKELYPNDDYFKKIFSFYKMPSRKSSKKIRFLLTQIEKSSGRNIDYLAVTLEHICPYNPEQEWIEAFGVGVNDVSDRLGNMVLLDRDELKRSSFVDKQRVYLDSPYRLASEVAKYQTWTLEDVDKYQDWLSDQAVKTWRVDYQ
ncbi:DUF262 domain-containing HNH endonuclease family protein [Bernardetia sp. Wsw4-3y2]|uniref:DUF262 domain-containing protein n=1 Tax=Bernardetia sp. Wsw4-3y2 TaxID=3127471 RepID=UPI0030CF70A8